MSAANKRQRTDKCAGLHETLAYYSETSIYKMQRLLAGEEKPKQRSGAFKRRTAAIVEPAKMCFRTVTVQAIDEEAEAVQFGVADIGATLRYISQRSPCFDAFVRSKAGCTLHGIVSHDEATAGNVLSANPRQKLLLFYLSFKELESFLPSARGWLPIGAVTHEQIMAAQGGLGGVTKAFLQEWHRQNLHVPFNVSPGCSVRLNFSMFLSDFESQRGALSSKGSAGLKPCGLCINLVAKYSDASEVDPTFCSLSEHRFDRFQLHEQASLEPYLVHAISQLDQTTLATKKARETLLGYNIDPHGIWGCPVSRNLLRLDVLCNDSMHCYYSNGICSAEIVLLLRAVQQHAGLGISQLEEAATSANWVRPYSNMGKTTESPYWCRRLWTKSFFEGEVYKGTATQTMALVALLRWLCVYVFSTYPALNRHVQCFLLLCSCVACLRKIAVTKDYNELARRQAKHHECFASLYGQALRPKHHHRLHLSDHYGRHGLAVSAWGCEAKHQTYKSVVSANFKQFLTEKHGGREFALHVLPRLLMNHVESLKDHPFVWAFELVNPFDEKDVFKASGLEGCRIAKQCHLTLCDLKENDVILWGREMERAGRCHFFLEKNDTMYIYLSLLEPVQRTEAMHSFLVTNDRVFVQFDPKMFLQIPSWISVDGNKIACLP